MVLFDWGTYNGLSRLRLAELLGTRLTEIPPGDFSRRRVGGDYFKKYAEASKGFTTVTAHAPYYSTVSEDGTKLNLARKALIDAVRKAELANAEIFNLHLGGKLEDIDRSIEIAAETVRLLLENSKKIRISLETTYSPKLLGSIDEIRAVMEIVDSPRLLISLQLENDWMRELKVWESGDFHGADKQVTKDFWFKILRKGLELGNGYLSLRFSQITGIKLRNFIVKKRVPLGMGYPNLEKLSSAIAEFMVKEVVDKEKVAEMHLIYTGPWQTKYQDTVKLYYAVMANVVEHVR